MFKLLQSYQDKEVVIELASGKLIFGKLVLVNQELIKMDTKNGIGIIPLNAINVIWESYQHSLTEENMRDIASKLRESANNRINCTAMPGFTCTTQYICTPPDSCTFTFACPGLYNPGGGGFCNPWQFQQPCNPWQFQQPCNPWQFQQPCTFQFGSQCFTPGGFACAGFSFLGGPTPADLNNKKSKER